MPQQRSIARSPAPSSRQVRRARAPAVVQPGRHDRVHEVVAIGDAIEHRPHLMLVARPACLAACHSCRSATSGSTGTRPERRTSSAAGPRTTASAPSGFSSVRAIAVCRQRLRRSRSGRARVGAAGLAELVAGAAARLVGDGLARSNCHAARRRAVGGFCRSCRAPSRARRGRSGRPSARSRRSPAVVAIGRRSGRRSGLRSIERQQHQQHHRDRRDADRREQHQRPAA